MKSSIVTFLFLLSVLFGSGSCETTEESTIDVKALIKTYKTNVNQSRILHKDDKRLTKTWTEEFLIKRLDISMKYRMEVVKHEEHSFGVDGNVLVFTIVNRQCVQNSKKEINRAKRFYHKKEEECLKAAYDEDIERKRGVEQFDKQMSQWRKTYRYLVWLCGVENPGDPDDAEQCLVDYMQEDNFDQVIQRLLLLKLKAMNDLYEYFNTSLVALEECFKTQLSAYLERVRSIMKILNICYESAV